MKRIHLIIEGKVQGVCFRRHTSKVADKLGLKGFVRNLSNGSVEVIAEGNDENIKGLLSFCKKGPDSAKVEDVVLRYRKATGEFSEFDVKEDGVILCH